MCTAKMATSMANGERRGRRAHQHAEHQRESTEELDSPASSAIR
jgi:hypothetical protein